MLQSAAGHQGMYTVQIDTCFLSNKLVIIPGRYGINYSLTHNTECVNRICYDPNAGVQKPAVQWSVCTA